MMNFDILLYVDCGKRESISVPPFLFMMSCFVLLKVSVETARENKVYEYLHKLRRTIRAVEESTMEILESWFCGEKAAEVGIVSLDQNEIKDAIMRNGGGWHGLGWLGQGEWVVRRSSIASDGLCCACSEQLVCVDIDRAETDKFAQSIASLAMERGLQSNFKEFQVRLVFFYLFNCLSSQSLCMQVQVPSHI